MFKRFISYYKPYKGMFFLDMLASLFIAIIGMGYPILTNTVSTKNTLHIKWLKRMGAKFSAPYLINDHYFQDFYIIKGD